ncbi:MAG: hypothetical protein ACI9VI_000845 [Candidatus Azotimanducaceae bacterium]|jgi:hypothetical protein
MRKKYRSAMSTSLVFVSLAMLIGGCAGSFSYKRGAGMADFEQERETCADQNNDEYEIEHCLKKSGWIVVGADKPLAKTPLKTIENPDRSVLIVDQVPIEDTLNPLDKIRISSWWKAGAGPEKLLAAGDICVEILGEEYKPEANFSTVTVGLVECMKGEGWFALEGK